MGHSKPKRLPKALQELRTRFEKWRSSSSKGRLIPQELWDAAVLLTQEHSISEVSHALGLNHTKLKQLVLKAKTTAEPENEANSLVESDFVRIEPLAMFETPTLSESIVELVDSDGAQLKIRVPAHQSLDFVALIDAFRRRG